MTKAFGMNPTPMAWSETFTALQQGTVAGVDVVIHSAVSANLHEVAPHLVLSGHFYTPSVHGFRHSFWTPCLLKTVRFEETFAEVQKIGVVPSHHRRTGNSSKLRAQGVDVIRLSPKPAGS